MKIKIRWLPLFVMIALLSACGGGGSDGSEGGSAENLDGVWEAQAVVTQDGCHERISPVHQKFTITGNQIETGIVTLTYTDTGNGISFGFSETNGDCVRNYSGEFTDLSGTSAVVSFTSTSNCAGAICENTWAGTATKVAE